MGTAYFIVLEHPIDDLDTFVDGKSLADNMQALDITARSLGVKPLSEFFSAEPADIREFLAGEDLDLGDIEPPPLENFSATEGLKTIRALLSHPLSAAEHLHADLKNCERILTIAEANTTGWHFEIDF